MEYSKQSKCFEIRVTQGVKSSLTPGIGFALHPPRGQYSPISELTLGPAPQQMI
jgi:hypothetical protein